VNSGATIASKKEVHPCKQPSKKEQHLAVEPGSFENFVAIPARGSQPRTRYA